MACESKLIGKKSKATKATEAAKKTKKQNREVVVATIETKIDLTLLKDEDDPTVDVLTIVGEAIVGEAIVSALGKHRRKLQGGYRYLLKEIRIIINWDYGSVINVSISNDCELGEEENVQCTIEVQSTILLSEKSLQIDLEEDLESSVDIDVITAAITSIEPNGSIMNTEVVKVVKRNTDNPSPTDAPIPLEPTQSPTSTPTTSPTQSPTTSPTDTDAPRATYIPYNDDPLKDTAIADFNKAVGQDPTSTDPYYAWCNLLGCPQFNTQAESWCIDGGQSACRNQCAALPGGSEPDNGVNRVCTRYGAPSDELI